MYIICTINHFFLFMRNIITNTFIILITVYIIYYNSNVLIIYSSKVILLIIIYNLRLTNVYMTLVNFKYLTLFIIIL